MQSFSIWHWFPTDFKEPNLIIYILPKSLFSSHSTICSLCIIIFIFIFHFSRISSLFSFALQDSYQSRKGNRIGEFLACKIFLKQQQQRQKQQIIKIYGSNDGKMPFPYSISIKGSLIFSATINLKITIFCFLFLLSNFQRKRP